MTSTNADAAMARRIMIVEDNIDSADTMQLLLGLSGYDAKTAYDGATALKLAREFMPQVVLCDIGLPDKDGYQVARELRALPETRGAFLVALTGYGNAEDKRLATAAGFDAFQVKPVEPDALNALLARHFSGSPS